MATRDVRIRIDNMTSTPWSLAHADVEHGDFTSQGSPPATVGADQQVEWRAAGTTTGTEGRVVYRMPGGETVTIGWANPLIGNTFFLFQISGGRNVFFSRHFAFNGAVGTGPGETPPLFAVTQGDTGEGSMSVCAIAASPSGSADGYDRWGDRELLTPARPYPDRESI